MKREYLIQDPNQVYQKGIPVMATDPVSLAIVDEDDAKQASSSGNQVYYFCCYYCSVQVEKNPNGTRGLPTM